MVNPISNHWTVAKRVLRYLEDSFVFSLIHDKGEKKLNILDNRDSDVASDMEDRKSTTR